MCMISEVTIDASARTSEQQLPMNEVSCVGNPLDGDDPVPAVVPMSEDEDGSDSEGYSSMSDDDDCDEEDDSEEVPQTESGSIGYHDLYLPVGTTAYTQPVVFSGGMDAEECEEYYRSLEEAAEAAAQREAAAAAAAQPTRKRSPLFRRIARRDSKKIKNHEGDDSSVASSSSYHSAASSEASSSSRSSVSFSESVTVHPIFTIDVFPDDVWDNTWTPRRQVKEGKRRAKLEFRYDGCDWRSATEEDGMFRDPRTGQLEHPVHYYDDELDNRRGNGDEVVQMCLIMPGRRC